jgi:hypothetical protein
LVDVVRFGVWNAALAAGAVLCVATAVAWILSSHAALPIWATVIGPLLTLFSLALLWSARGARPVRLRWTDGLWHICPSDGSDECSLDRVIVAIDLDSWKLLRCETAGNALARSVYWLPCSAPVCKRTGARSDARFMSGRRPSRRIRAIVGLFVE